MDVLASVLSTASVSGSVAATVRAGGTWGLALAEVPGAAFHAVTSGSVHLRVDGHAETGLAAGDVVLLPAGSPHDLVSETGARTRPFDHVRAEAGLHDGADLVIGDAPATTQIICASYTYDPAARISPFAVLPEVVHVPALAAPAGLRNALSLISDELSAPGPGLRSVLDHVVNIVLVQVLRCWIDRTADDRPPSWLRGLGEPTTRRALVELHADPAFPWTVGSLAARVGVSRATLARRFESEVGLSPGEYISAWRMELAARSLRSGDQTVGTVARSVGYQSEYAFNRAFTRRFGTPPGRYRSSLRPSPAT